MLELQEALEKILAPIPPTKSERVSSSDAHSRVLAEKIFSAIDLPPFDNSSMDGYAVRAEDVTSASAEKPIPLELVGKVAAGESFNGEMSAGQCIRIFTGSPLPHGADAVVMQEDTRVEGSQPHEVWFLDSVKPWENVRFRGEDVKRGAAIAEAGDTLSAGKIALLAATGLTHLSV